MYETSYARASSIEEAKALFAKGTDAKYLAGGHTLIPTMKQRLAAPDTLVDITRIAEMKGISRDGDRLVVGGGTTHKEISESDEVKSSIAGLAEMALHIGDPAVRYRGTIGGAIANNDPSACYPSAAMALDAIVRTDRREVTASEFFLGMFETPLEEDELVTAVALRIPEASTYQKFPNPASRYAMAGVFVARLDGRIQIGVTGASGSGVFRWTEAEEALASNPSPQALDALSVDPSGLMADIHATAEYRANLVKVMAKRGVAAIG